MPDVSTTEKQAIADEVARALYFGDEPRLTATRRRAMRRCAMAAARAMTFNEMRRLTGLDVAVEPQVGGEMRPDAELALLGKSLNR